MAPPDAAVAHVSFDALQTEESKANNENGLGALQDPVATSPTTGAPLVPLTGPAAWKPADLLASQNWGRTLTEPQIAELHAALAHAKTHGLEWEDVDGMRIPANMSKELFALGPECLPLVAEMAAELEDGTGAVMIRNFPVENVPEEDVGALYVGFCTHLGVPRWQSSAGLRSRSRGYGVYLGRVRAEMKGNTPEAGKQSNNYFRLHTDRCDVISLLGIRAAAKGGASRVASAVTIYNEMLEKYPTLVPKLFNPVERIWEGKDGKVALPLMDITKEGKFTSQISPSYIECAQLLPGSCPLDADTVEAIDLVEEIGLKHCVEFVMQPGCVYWLNNHQVYHGRTAWADSAEEVAPSFDDAAQNPAETKTSIPMDGSASAPADGGRLLFRVWLSPYNSRALPDDPAYRYLWGDVAAGAPRGGLEPAIATGESSPEVLREAMRSAKHNYYGLYKRRFA
ncbi:predicted protein [Micromonas commoda]|uniref:TauD/TfdA-like domain-containing protein n=1 Tax=Micromonas commoda (strain RCC299 / NOUM17 / CCMP2709) TaxID=296587 RepID=C1E2T4_MICCC|nr:predicted protein [Micromonas commoda]ACO62399.1 predicted protein [Micromonas commoda]|eukprot:XP_002501141.1 predicted protein [Micromonas commoda]